MMWNVQKSNLEKMSRVCVCARVRACKRSKKLIICNSKIDWAIGLKFGVLEDTLENTLTCANFQISIWNFNYKCSYDQGCLVLHLASFDKVFQNLWHFFHNFRFNSYNLKTTCWAEIQHTIVEQLTTRVSWKI